MAQTAPRDDFVAELKWRGFFEQCTDEAGLRDLLAAPPATAYIGFDPTADSLHVGSLLPIMGLVHLQRHGHRPLAIVGGGTALVGDPSGKTELRAILSEEQIEQNLRGLEAQLGRFLRMGEGPTDARLLNNADWLRDWRYIDFLREVGRHFSVNRMLTMESVRQRLEAGLSFLEFNYMLLQAYDFLVLARDFGCRLQMGGSDQWGNIVSGIDLIRRVRGEQAYGLTFPLMTTAAGVKMGKTAAGAVWLDARRTSPFEFHQYWINTDDRDVGRFLRLYTLLPREEIEQLESLAGADIRLAKRRLAREVTALVHGGEQAAAAERAASALFGGGGGSGDEAGGEAGDEAGPQGAAIPASAYPAAELAAGGAALVEILAQSGLVKSRGEARRLVRQGGVKVNGETVSDELRRLGPGDVRDGRIVLQLGKKRYHHLLIG